MSTPGIGRGLLVFGQRVLVPGLSVFGPGDEPTGTEKYIFLDAGDYCMRPSSAWVRQVIVHTTKGDWPQSIVPSPGLGGYGKSTADYWSKSFEGKATHGGAHIVIDNDGTVFCLADLGLVEAYHATTSNPWSIGIEMYQEAGGVIRQCVLDATAKLVPFLCKLFSFAFQIPDRIYNNDAMDRMKFSGGPDMVGVFGHRDNAWDFVRKTSSRGRGDPGDAIYSLLHDVGAEPLDFVARKDIEIWKRRQRGMNRDVGAHLLIDGIAGPGTMHVVDRGGYANVAFIPLVDEGA